MGAASRWLNQAPRWQIAAVVVLVVVTAVAPIAWVAARGAGSTGCHGVTWKSVTVLADVAAGWPDKCLGLKEVLTPSGDHVRSPEECAQACVDDQKCAVWQLTRDRRCFSGIGDYCYGRAGDQHFVPLAGQRLQHGFVTVQQDITGQWVSGLYQVGLWQARRPWPNTDSPFYIDRCRRECYSDFECRYWQFGEGGCWLERPSAGYTAADPPVVEDGTASALAMKAGEWIHHTCVPPLGIAYIAFIVAHLPSAAESAALGVSKALESFFAALPGAAEYAFNSLRDGYQAQSGALQSHPELAGTITDVMLVLLLFVFCLSCCFPSYWADLSRRMTRGRTLASIFEEREPMMPQPQPQLMPLHPSPAPDPPEQAFNDVYQQELANGPGMPSTNWALPSSFKEASANAFDHRPRFQRLPDYIMPMG